MHLNVQVVEHTWHVISPAKFKFSISVLPVVTKTRMIDITWFVFASSQSLAWFQGDRSVWKLANVWSNQASKIGRSSMGDGWVRVSEWFCSYQTRPHTAAVWRKTMGKTQWRRGSVAVQQDHILSACGWWARLEQASSAGRWWMRQWMSGSAGIQRITHCLQVGTLWVFL